MNAEMEAIFIMRRHKATLQHQTTTELIQIRRGGEWCQKVWPESSTVSDLNSVGSPKNHSFEAFFPFGMGEGEKDE